MEQTISVDNLSVMIQGGVVLKHPTSMFLRVTYIIHEGISGKAFDEPDTPEHIEIVKIKTGYNVVLTNPDAGIRLELRPNADITSILVASQLEEIRCNIKKQARGCVSYIVPCTMVTSDNLRLPEDDAIKTHLGHDLVRKEYAR